MSFGEPYVSRKGHTVSHWVQEEHSLRKSGTVEDIGGNYIRMEHLPEEEMRGKGDEGNVICRFWIL